jgi:pimeloyl-ACP methyl ester carboxylesterase
MYSNRGYLIVLLLPYYYLLFTRTVLLTLPSQPLTGHPIQRAEVMRRNQVRIVGHGKPPLLLCNGFGYSQRVWQTLVTALAQDHQVILFDHVGTGGSDVAAYDADKYAHLGGYVQDLLDICRVLELEQAVLTGRANRPFRGGYDRAAGGESGPGVFRQSGAANALPLLPQ